MQIHIYIRQKLNLSYIEISPCVLLSFSYITHTTLYKNTSSYPNYKEDPIWGLLLYYVLRTRLTLPAEWGATVLLSLTCVFYQHSHETLGKKKKIDFAYLYLFIVLGGSSPKFG